ncbi:MAG: hypothetical protein AB1646_03520 [Thermodesulfobacteriota bacterium]
MANTVDHLPKQKPEPSSTEGADPRTATEEQVAPEMGSAAQIKEHRGISWNTHSILTRTALESVESGQLDGRVPVLPLEDFLHTVREGIRFLVGWYWDTLGRKTGTKPHVWAIPRDVDTVDQFLKALKLNPSLSIPYVRVMRPEEIGPAAAHNPGRSGPPGRAYVPTPYEEQISPREILCTFSDEPDWGMDQDLFVVRDYAYGPVPFGSATGKSSQAAFHMAFLHEPALITAVWPGLRRSFMEERIRVCLALARLAFKAEAHYWGWRFLSWAMHYIQDLTQPYHAKAFPPSLGSLLRRFMLDPNPAGFAQRNANLLKNHHILFESVAHYLLNEALKKDPDAMLLSVIRQSGESRSPTVRSLMERESRISASLAARCDRALVKMVDDKRLDAKDFTLDEGAEFLLQETMLGATQDRPRQYGAFTELLGRSLAQAGAVTRYCLRTIEVFPGRRE